MPRALIDFSDIASHVFLRNKVQCQNEVTACSRFTQCEDLSSYEVVKSEILPSTVQQEVKMGLKSKILFINNVDLS